MKKEKFITIPEHIQKQIDEARDIRPMRPWETWEIEVVEKYYGVKPSVELARILNRTPTAVRQKAAEIRV